MKKDWPSYLDYPKERKVITRADRLRNASDKDLPEELLRVVYDLFESGEPSREYMEFWFSQPAEEEGDL